MKNIVTALLLAVGTVAFAQVPRAQKPTEPVVEIVVPKAPYDSTKAQLSVEKLKNYNLRIEKLKDDAMAQIGSLGNQFQDQQKVLEDWAASIRKANGWDLTYNYDADKDQWEHTVPTVPAPAKK